MRKLLIVSALVLVTALLIGAAPPLPQDAPISSPVIDNPDLISAQFQNLIAPWAAAIQPFAYEIFYALAGLELATFGWYLWQHHRGDISGAIIATAGKILVISLFLTLLMNGGNWMGAIINGFVDVGKGATGLPGLSPGTIVGQGLTIGGILWAAAEQQGSFLHPVPGLALFLCGFIIALSFLAIAAEFIMCKVMAAIALSAGLIMLAFGASRWTVGFTERFFSLAFSIGLRLLVLYFMVGAGWSLTGAWIQQAKDAPTFGNSIEMSMAIVCAALLYGFLCLRVPAIVSSTLSGSPSLGHGDFMNFITPAISAAVSAAMVVGGVAAGVATAGMAGGAAKATSGGGSASASTGGSAPKVAPQSSGGGGSPSHGGSPSGADSGSPGSGGQSGVRVAAEALGRAARGGAQIVRTGANAAGRMSQNGHHAPPPRLDHFGH